MKLAICGSGGCGKDTVCDWLAKHTNLRYTGSTSWYAASDVFDHMQTLGIEYPSIVECYNDRGQHRQIWADVINQINNVDRTKLYKLCLEEEDILNGIRNRDQLVACKADNLVDLIVWIDRSVKHDPTMGYGSELCDIVIPNKHGVPDLIARLSRLVRCLKIGVNDEASSP